VTRRLQDRESVLKLGDNAVGQGPTSGPALVELRKLVKIAPDDATRAAAQGEIAKVMSFWGSGATYLNPDYQITNLNGKPVKESALTTCDLLILLRSSFWKDRARAAQLLTGRAEKGIPEALVSAAADPYLDVATHAIFSLRTSAGRFFGTYVCHSRDNRWGSRCCSPS
jgi:hypothetical protein